MQVKAESPLVSAASGLEVNFYVLGRTFMTPFLVGAIFGGLTVYCFYRRAAVAQLRASVSIWAEGAHTEHAEPK